nr:immunoglobulin light chain junction region [Macaca mulatta]MOV79259.1 immunoglobulin light chain junction region [Macaca mulatta]MOV79836.1 immunoglobulin light chain junction region [Macaca mulatta]MOV79891.1 immunoglobulin light chain junction region [Macaca mulatta]MOV81818.1 immunoglobulin light chain junction region [Macaca mulatta]
CLQFKSYPNSF